MTKTDHENENLKKLRSSNQSKDSLEDSKKNNSTSDRIEIFATDDEKIKSFGEILTNDSSRQILQKLLTEELSANQISNKTKISLQLVKYHLNKMQQLDIVKVSKVEKNIKGGDMKFYKATKFAIVILPSTISAKAKDSKPFLRSFQTLYRFSGIAIAGIAAWFTTVSFQSAPLKNSIEFSEPETTGTPFKGGVDESSFSKDVTESPQDDFESFDSSSQLTSEPSVKEETLEFEKTLPQASPKLDAGDRETPGDPSPEILLNVEDSPPSSFSDIGKNVADSLGWGTDIFWPILITSIVVSLGIVIDFYLRKKFRKKRIPI